jgi:hypothetical protein
MESALRNVLPCVRRVRIASDIRTLLTASCDHLGWNIQDEWVHARYISLAKKSLNKPMVKLMRLILDEIDDPVHAEPLLLKEMVDWAARKFYSCPLKQNGAFCHATLHQHILSARPTLDVTATISEMLYDDNAVPTYDAFLWSAAIGPSYEWRRSVTKHVYRALSRLQPTSTMGEFFNPLMMAVMRGYVRSPANPLYIRKF